MSEKDNFEQKEAYLDALKTSPVSRELLKKLHAINDNTLDKWLYVPNRYPPFRACFELWMFLRSRKMIVHKKLHLLIGRSRTRAREAYLIAGPLEESKKTNSDGTIRKAARIYLYHGEEKTIKEIAIILHKTVGTVSAKLKRLNIAPGQNANALDHSFRISISERQDATKWLFNGNKVTLKTLSKITGLSMVTISNRIRAWGRKPGDDISDVDYSYYNRRKT